MYHVNGDAGYYSTLKIEKVTKEIKDPKRVLFDTEFKDSLELQIKHQTEGDSAKAMRTDNPGILVSMMGFGRMSVCNELLLCISQYYVHNIDIYVITQCYIHHFVMYIIYLGGLYIMEENDSVDKL